jgi:hypothetical protein
MSASAPANPYESPREPSSASPANRTPAWMRWTGWVITVLPVLGLVMSAVMKFMRPAEVVEGMKKAGWPDNLLFGLGVLEVTCTILYLIPQTAVLGAILLTGYLGGAVATHVRIGEGFAAPVIMGVLVWLGVFLRDSRLRALIPIRW